MSSWAAVRRREANGVEARRIDAQVLLQDLAQPTEGVQGLRLTPVPVQREQQLAPPPLAQRAVRHQGLEPADNLVVVTQRQFGLEQVLRRGLAQLLERQRLRGRERAISELPSAGPRHKSRACLSNRTAAAGSPPVISGRPSAIRLSARPASVASGRGPQAVTVRQGDK
jgi:hypothetical protein